MLIQNSGRGCVYSTVLLLAGTGAAYGQDYPNKPIRLVASAAGGAIDFAARLIAPGLSSSLGQQVVVENRPSGVIPGEIVAKSPPDGYTLLAAGGTLWIGPLLQKAPYDPAKDFAAISLTNRQPNILVVHPSVPVKSVKELVALAKARPGELNYASGGSGTSPHLAAELFKSMAGVNIMRIPYKGSGPAVIGLISGQVQMTFDSGPSLIPHIKSGKLRALAVTTAQPTELVPGLPTVAASGLPGYESASTIAIFAPAGTPAPVIRRLNQEIVRVLGTTDVKGKFFSSGAEAAPSTPEALSAMVKLDIAKWSKVIKDAGITGD